MFKPIRDLIIRDVMHPGVISCPPDASLGMVAVLLTNHKIHAIAVADAAKRVLGIITDFDLLAGEWLSTDPDRLKTMQAMTAGELMTSPADTIEADTPVKEAARKMLSTEIHRLLVIDNGKPVGVLSIADFVSVIAHTHPHRFEKIPDVMSDALLVCREKTPIRSAARTMMITGWRSILVVNSKGTPQGLITGTDLLVFFEKGKIGRNKTVAHVMHAPLTIHMSATLREAANKMIEHHYHRLIVVDPEQPDAMPLGLLSSYDIVGKMASPKSGWR